MKTTLSVKEANVFAFEANQIAGLGKTKLNYAIEQIFSDFQKSNGLAKLHAKEDRKIRVNNAAVDANQCLIVENKLVNGQEIESFKYTKEGQLKLEDELEELTDKQFPFEAYECQDIPILTEAQIKAFEGIVIPIGYTNPEKSVEELKLTEA